MALDLWTGRMGYRGPDWLDVSLQGNLKRGEAEKAGHRGVGFWFAPPPSLVYPFLSARRFGRETPELQAQYREAYLAHLRERYRDLVTRKAFTEVLSWPRVVLLCFCKAGQFCHRRILAEVLVLTGQRLGMAVVDHGELEPDTEPPGDPYWLSPAAIERAAAPAVLVMPQHDGNTITMANRDHGCVPFEITNPAGERVGSGHVCRGRSSRRRKCKGLPTCTRTMEYLCDFPLAGAKAGKTCDRPLCGGCAKTMGSDLHYCPSHVMLDPEGRMLLG